MCTLTIWREDDRFTVTMNRDDAQTRPEAPPQLQRGAHGAYMAPRDEQAGGSWIAANERGLIACLLNRYDQAPQGRSSRGGIVLQAMNATSAHDAALTLSPTTGDYSPFTCMLIDRNNSVRVDWNGAHVTRQTLDHQALEMLTSSSWRQEDVRAQRSAVFSALVAGPQPLGDAVDAFHCHTEADGDVWTPMMQRPTSHTKSITRVRVSLQNVAMSYWRRETALSRGLAAADVSLTTERTSDASLRPPTDRL